MRSRTAASSRELLEQIERGGGEPAAALTFLARHALELDEEAVRAATRRALLVLAAGGDPRRELSLADRAVVVLARELDGEQAQGLLAAALRSLRAQATNLARVTETLDRLLSEPDRALLWLALVILADELSEGHPIE
jgi:hypothetical protein